MKIVICGDNRNLVSFLAEKFVRESHSVFQITGNKGLHAARKYKNFIAYDIELTSENLKYVLMSIAPDVVIFLGVNDHNFTWKKNDETCFGYLACLINLMMAASDISLSKFIYLSDYSACGHSDLQTEGGVWPENKSASGPKREADSEPKGRAASEPENIAASEPEHEAASELVQEILARARKEISAIPETQEATEPPATPEISAKTRWGVTVLGKRRTAKWGFSRIKAGKSEGGNDIEDSAPENKTEDVLEEVSPPAAEKTGQPDIIQEQKLALGDEADNKNAMSIFTAYVNTDTALRSISVSEGESLCMQFNDAKLLRALVLRINGIFGNLYSADYEPDKIIGYCIQAINENKINYFDEGAQQYIYMSDAVEAIYRVCIKDDLANTVYDVTGGQLYTDEMIASLIKASLKKPSVVFNSIAGDKKKTAARSNNEFFEAIGFSQYVSTEQGIANVASWTSRNIKQLSKAKTTDEDKKKTGKNEFLERFLFLFRGAKPFIENLFVLSLAVAATFFTRETAYVQNIDFMLLYVVIIAAVLGNQQSVLAVLASGIVYMLGQNYLGISTSNILTDYNFVIRLLTFFTISLIVGNVRDGYRSKVAEKDEQIAFDENEIEELKKIYDTTLNIKNIYEERLLNYGDSLAKVYAIVSELEGLSPQMIYNKAIGVVSRIMNSDRVAIYYCAPESNFCRLVASTASINVQKSLVYSNIPGLSLALSKREVFVNKELRADAPFMASPVFRGENLISLIMLWDVSFEKLNPYQTNLFVVLTRLITNSLERAFAYEESTNERKIIKGTCMYTYEAMSEFYEIAVDAKKSNGVPFSIVAIENDESEYEEISERISTSLRVYDYIGISKKGQLVILLSNTTNEEAKFLVDRISKLGIKTTILGLSV